MSNSDYEDREMEYLIGRGTDSERDEKPNGNEEDQEEDPKANENPGQKTKEHPASEWARWIEKNRKETEYSIKHQSRNRKRPEKRPRKREEVNAKSLKRTEVRRPGHFPVWLLCFILISYA